MSSLAPSLSRGSKKRPAATIPGALHAFAGGHSGGGDAGDTEKEPSGRQRLGGVGGVVPVFAIHADVISNVDQILNGSNLMHPNIFAILIVV